MGFNFDCFFFFFGDQGKRMSSPGKMLGGMATKWLSMLREALGPTPKTTVFC